MKTPLAALLLLPICIGAQTIRGSVVDRADSAAVSGVVVLLLDAGGSVVARALTNERGEFRLPANAAGAYRVRTLRIGFRPVTSDPVLLSSGQEVTRQLVVAGVPFSLDTVRVQKRSTCRMNVDSALVTYAIWEQVRMALTATDLSTRARMGATIVTFERILDPKTKRVRDQKSSVRAGVTQRPWISLSADTLQRFGYVAEVNGWQVFAAPDIDVLLSSQFLEDHCFRIADADSTRIGLAFEPTRERSKIPEIKGTVWLDRKSSELRRMEFVYTNISREQEQGDAGGEMVFVRTKRGPWAISSWNIRMPVLQETFFERGNAGDMGPKRERLYRVSGLKVAGGDLALLTRGGDTLWSRPPLTVTGTVADSASGRPIVDARVAIRGTTLETVSDSGGMFKLDGVIPGEYFLQVRTPALDSVAVTWLTSLSVSDGSRPVEAHLPSTADMVARLCPIKDRPIGMVVGQVRFRGDTPDTVPRGGVGVIAEWHDLKIFTHGPVVVNKTPMGLDARTDVTGTYRMCGLPLNTRFALRTELETTGTMVAAGIPPQTRFVRLDLLVGKPDAVVSAAVAGGATFQGNVLRASDRRPVAGAEVAFPDLGFAARSDSLGAFRVTDVPAGTHAVAVRQLGYAAVNVSVSFAQNETVSREFVLGAAQVLDTVAVAGRRPNLPEFEERRKMGIGHFVTREELDKQENRRMSEVLSQVGGLRVVRATGANNAWISAGRGQLAKYDPDPYSAAMGARPMCYVDVWMDGVRIYAGGLMGAPLFDVNSVMPATLEGVEYYTGAAQIPAKYTRVNQECGVLVLWTRRGP
jgi:hypothetical protein